jgi:hypothetical protein
VLLVVPLVVIVPMAVSSLIWPYSGVRVPTTCRAEAMGEPVAVRVTVPGVGDGTLVASDGPSRVVAVAAADGHTAGGSAHVLAGDSVVFSVPIASRVVAAGVADGRVYLFDDKLGYFLDASTGIRLPRLFTADNYRGIYTSGGAEFVQTTFEVSAVGMDGRPFMAETLRFGAIVDGCMLASAVSD